MRVKGLGDANIIRVATLLLALISVIVGMLGCSREAPMLPKEGEMTLSLSSSAFEEGEKIPPKYTCKGQSISPPLTWGEPPQETRGFVLIMDDPDAPGGVFTHWVLFNLPTGSRELLEAIPAQKQLPNGGLQGKNSFGKIGYGGPCPPPGHPHHYRFTLYALDKPLDLKAGTPKKQVIDGMEGHVLAEGQLIGTYQR